MAKLGSPKRAFMLSMGLILYIILVALLMFYIEECSIDRSEESEGETGSNLLHNNCKWILASLGRNGTINGTKLDVSMDACTKLVRKLVRRRALKEPTCRFNVINYLPWVHTVAFSLMTIGGTHSPVTVAGQILLTLSTIIGVIPSLRLTIHTGIIICRVIERGILVFELRILGRNPRMIHNAYGKIFFFICLILILYNSMLAWITSLPFYRTQWTFSKAMFFWLQGMLTVGHRIEAADTINFYSNGGWRSICIDFAMIGNILLLSSLVCAITLKMHKKNCHAIKTIKSSFKNQSPEVYLNIKNLTTHL